MSKSLYICLLLARRLRIFLIGLVLLVSCGENGSQAPEEPLPLVNGARAEERRQEFPEQDLYRSRQNAITRAVETASPAIVGINVTQVRQVYKRSPFMNDPFWRQLFRDRIYNQEVKSLGSGFIISRDGYVVTNEHVVSDASEILVTMTNGRRFRAEVIGSDPLTDIALLKIDADNLPYLELGRSNDLIVGEWTIALGNPFGLFELNDQPTVTVGVISAVDRDWGRTRDGRLYMDMIQTDAAINHGNSGGPLLNALGQVIGMNTFIYTGSNDEEGFVGIGFAIPIDKINEIITEIRENGSVNRRFWIGIIDVQRLNRYIVNALQLSVDKGVIITRLERDGPAHQAGIRLEDVIVAIEGTEITSRENYIDAIQGMDLRVGDVVNFVVVRDRQRLTVPVVLEKAPEFR